MKQIKLSIIIPYHNEPEQVIFPLFNSIDQQLEIDFDAIEIILCNNCYVPKKPPFIQKGLFKNITNNIKYILPARKNWSGLSRQYAIDSSLGEYIIICDDDDCLYSPTTLHQIFKNIDINPDIDLFEYSELIETGDRSNFINYSGQNLVLVHGKVYKTEFLRANNVRFSELLETHDDVYFNLILNCAFPKTLLIDSPIYIWKKNLKSVSHSENFYKNNITDDILKGFYAYWKIKYFYQLDMEKVRHDTEGAILKSYDENIKLRNLITTDKEFEVLQDYENLCAMFIEEFDSNLHCLQTYRLQPNFVNYVKRILTNYVEKFRDKYREQYYE